MLAAMPIPSSQIGRSARKSGYIPSLDGWRAFAIIGVMCVHDLKWSFAGHPLSPYQDVGGSGVYLFFAISGILITTRILEEETLCGFFDIKKFYVRRIFRIQPAAWLYLAVIGCLMGAGLITTKWRHWFGALGMYENFLYGGKHTTIRDSSLGTSGQPLHVRNLDCLHNAPPRFSLHKVS
jgi:peptidoglycan/LPS O-acetylase OafA/YrhL